MNILDRHELNIKPNTTTIRIDSVSRWFHECYEKENFYFSDFPRCVPPYENVWLEYRMPSKINSNGEIEKMPKWAQKLNVGCYIRTSEIPKKQQAAALKNDVLYYSSSDKAVNPEDLYKRKAAITKAVDSGLSARWISIYELFYSSRENIKQLGYIKLYVDQHGNLIDNCELSGVPSGINELYNELWARMWCFLFSVSLLNCDKKIILTDKTAKPRKRSNGNPGVRYKVLDVSPLKAQIRNEYNTDTGVKKALHFVRGHFATYTDDNPLFGKVTGTFWKQAHVRGSRQYGEIIKKYNVNYVE